MPTTVLLIRHAAHDRPGPLLVGRDDSVRLSREGRDDAGRLADSLARHRLAAVVTSPSLRCRMTADMIAAPHGLALKIEPDVDEIDFGAWRGRTFAELDDDPEWRRFNTARGSARIPGGETMVAVEARVERALHRIGDHHPDRLVALVSHGDVIRTALCRVLALPPDLMARFEVEPASISSVLLGAGAPRLLTLNWIPDCPFGSPNLD